MDRHGLGRLAILADMTIYARGEAARVRANLGEFIRRPDAYAAGTIDIR